MIIKFLGSLIVMGCLTTVYLFDSSASSAKGFARILHWPAMVLTGIGPFGVVFLCSDWETIRDAFRLLVRRSTNKYKLRHEEEATYFQELTHRYYSQGSKAFDSVSAKNLSLYNRKVLERIAVKTPLKDVMAVLLCERGKTEVRFVRSLNLVAIGLRLAPSIGMLGTILGMVRLLSSLNDPSLVGNHMGLALLTTFFGLFFSILIWTPLYQRLENFRDIELRGYDQTLQWLELLEQRKPMQFLADMLNVRPHQPRIDV